DSNASPRQRAAQLRAVLDSLGQAPQALVGGDFNTSTYDVSTPLSLMRDLCHKLLVTGFRRTIEGYLTPERRYERPVFELLAERGYSTLGFNQRARGTMNFDLNDPYAVAKTERHVGKLVTRLL